MTAIGILKNLEVRYVYEQTNIPMSLPHLPLGPNMDLFGSGQIALEGMLDQVWDRSLVDHLNPTLRGLIEEADGKARLKPLGRFLWDTFREQAGMSALGRATAQESLLAHLNEDLKAKFRAISRLDHLIWKGDRVPEMVEHATRHHTNLFALAHRILLPCFRYIDEDFLEPEELFVLLCALLLHDCGHVIGTVRWPQWNGDGKELLFPGEIREFHNILGYMRLERGFCTDNLDPLCEDITKSEPWEGLSKKEIWEGYLRAAAVAGLFHRQAMPLHAAGNAYVKCGFFGPVKPLTDSRWDGRIGTKQIEKEKMLRIVALLRFIDSLDNQGTRTGGEHFVRFHLHTLEAEVEELEGRIRNLEKNGGLPESVMNDLSCYCNTVSKVINETHMDREKLREVIRENPDNGYVVRHYMELLLTKRFKKLQREHYGEHLPVSRVLILPRHGNSGTREPKLTFRMDVEIDEEMAKGQKMTLEECRKKVVKKMRDEKPGIADILERAGIALNYL